MQKKKIDELHQVPPINLDYCINHSEITKKKKTKERKESGFFFSFVAS
jgi:hypothetical protein